MVTAASPAVEEAEVTVKADEESALGLQKKIFTERTHSMRTVTRFSSY